MMNLRDYQRKAIADMKNGCILCGGVGSGKSITALGYYFIRECGGDLTDDGDYIRMRNPKNLYIITTARKRDTLEWQGDMGMFLLTTNPELSMYPTKVVVDSWNNIGKYIDAENSFFIFDEQRLVGSGAWVKAFYKIAKKNHWILLSATPGDTWVDYIPVFVANGFYKNKTEFMNEHVVYSRYVKYKIDRYWNVSKLIRLRDSLLVDMEFTRDTVSHHEDVYVTYDISMYKDTMRTRTDPYTSGYIPCRPTDKEALEVGVDIHKDDIKVLDGWIYQPKDGDYVKIANKPFRNAQTLCHGLRRIVNSDESRLVAVLELFEKHPRMIIFYNFDYELELLSSLYYGDDVEVAEWNGHRHMPIPESDKWIYLVQYTAGAEGWNCIKTDTIVFYSQNYSYKVMEQAAGRIDRLNTPYIDLYYYHLKSRSGIDLAISKTLDGKKKFNERKFVKW